MPDITTPTPSPTPTSSPASATPSPTATPAAPTPTPPTPTTTTAPAVTTTAPPNPPTPPAPTPTPVTPPTTPPTAPPASPASQSPKPEHSRLGPLIGFFVIILAACLLLLTHNPWLSQPAATNAPAPTTSPANQTIVIPPPAATSTPEASTSTLETATTTQTVTVYPLGSVVRFFAGDVVKLQNPQSEFSATVTAVEFSDSRCKKDVVCIWAGERGVHLKVTDDATQQTQDVLLGTTRVKTADALGLHFTLRTIDDAKGGTYADVLIK